jgi:crotonobetainyl-CoA:carnitine CoA-transferase CaiB-like acyl-CoA transferase
VAASAALAGIRVLDFSRHMAGPYAAQALADHGADVIKVEALPGGDPARQVGVDFIGDQSALFLIWNRGKRGLALNLRQAEAIKIAGTLAANADIVLENYRPGVADRIGIGYERLAAINPKIIYCSVTAFGPVGPLAGEPGTDPVVQAMSGVMSVTGEPDGSPNLVGIPIADFTGSMLAVQGILLALVARDRTGRGQKVEVSMLAGLLSSLTTRVANHWATGKDPERHGSAHSVVVPYQAFKASDAYFVAGVWGGSGWPDFCTAIDLPELVDDQRYATNAARVSNRVELTALLAGIFAKHPREYWAERFRTHDVLYSPVLSFSEALNHPQVQASGLVQHLRHPTAGVLPQIASPITLSDTPGALHRPPPLLGEHSRQILREAGFGDEQITDWMARGIVASTEIPAAV